MSSQVSSMPDRRLFRGPAFSSLIVATILAGCSLASVDGSPTASGSVPSAAAPSVAISAGPSVSPSFTRPTPTPMPGFIEYIVRGGDNLTAIARTFSTTARSIAIWNRAEHPNLDPYSPHYRPDRIGVGWRLRIQPGVIVDESELPSPDPSPSPSAPASSATPRPSPNTEPSPPTTGPSMLVSHGPRSSKRIALTFDMGGRLDAVIAIVDELVARDVPATLFLTGEAASTPTGGAVLSRIAAHPDLFDVGNHTWSHPDLTTVSVARIRSELDRTESLIAAATGRSTRPWFRPPFGAQDAAVRAAVGGGGWAYTVVWDVDSIDWKPESDGGPTTEDLIAKVLSRAQNGSIVLFHLGGYNTLEALPDVVGGLRERGFELVTMSDLLGR